jgi:Sec-independent protein translocase protein TatA
MGEAIRGFKKGLEGTEIDVTPTAKREVKDGQEEKKS